MFRYRRRNHPRRCTIEQSTLPSKRQIGLFQRHRRVCASEAGEIEEYDETELLDGGNDELGGQLVASVVGRLRDNMVAHWW
jgi:hypothetical protein